MSSKNWFKFIVILGVCIILIGLLATISDKLLHDVVENVEVSFSVSEQEQFTKTKDLVINIPEPCSEGTVTVVDNDGVEHFQYGGRISIRNDGLDGDPIKIYVYISSEDPAHAEAEQ